MKFAAALPALVVALVASLAFAQTPPAASQPAQPHLRFAQVTDTHVGILDNAQRCRKVVEGINSYPRKIDLVVHTGDITHEKTDEPAAGQTVAIFSQLKSEMHYVPGNHDILNAPMLAAFRKTFGEVSSKTEVNGVVCLFFYCEPLCRDVSVRDYNPWTWLETQLKDAGDKPVIIFMHTPTIPDLLGNLAHVGWLKDATQRFSDLVNAHNVKGVVCGHLHTDKDYKLGKVPVFVANSVSGAFGRHTCFRVYDYADGKLTYQTVYK